MKRKNAFTLIELLAVIVILAVIALIAVPLVMDTIEDAKKASLERSYDNIEHSAENYVYAKLDELKIPNYQEYYLPVKDLSDSGYLKNADEEMLTNHVIVKKSDDNMTFYYTGRDNNPYGSKGTLKNNIEKDTSHIIKNVQLNGTTVNKVIGTKSEKDTVMKNYVWYSGNLWQVVETTDGYVKMVLAHSITLIPYGETSDWNTSWVRKWLNDTGEDYSGIFYNGLNRTDLLLDGQFCLDEPSVTTKDSADNDKAHLLSIVTGATKLSTCQNIVSDKVGLLTFEDYAYALNGSFNVSSPSFIDEDEIMWTLTKATKNSRSDQVWTTWYQNVDGHAGNLTIEKAGSYTNSSGNTVQYNPYVSITKAYGLGVRPVVYMKANVPVTSGTGTKKDPFLLVSENKSVSKLNQATIGEYIYLDEGKNPYTTPTENVVNGISYTYNKNKVRYRIIDVLSDGSIKVERADILRNLPNTIAINSGIYVPYYYNGNTDSTGCGYINNTWYTSGCANHNYFNLQEGTGEYNYNNSMNLAYYLNNASNSFYNWFSDTTKSYILKTDWELPVTAHTTDYSTRMDRSKDIVGQSSYQNNTYDGEVSAYVGLPSYGERYSGNDLNINYWYINRWGGSTSLVGHVHSNGYAGSNYAGFWTGTRPVMVLDAKLNIQSGFGTSMNPCEIGM